MTQLRLAYVNLRLLSKPKAARSPLCETCLIHSSELPPIALKLARLQRLRPDEAKVIGEMIDRLLAELIPPDEHDAETRTP